MNYFNFRLIKKILSMLFTKKTLITIIFFLLFLLLCRGEAKAYSYTQTQPYVSQAVLNALDQISYFHDNDYYCLYRDAGANGLLAQFFRKSDATNFNATVSLGPRADIPLLLSVSSSTAMTYYEYRYENNTFIYNGQGSTASTSTYLKGYNNGNRVILYASFDIYIVNTSTIYYTRSNCYGSIYYELLH